MDNQSNKIIYARSSFVHTSPRKLRLVARAVAKLSPMQAINQLRVMDKKAATPILKVMEQGVANAKNNFQISPAALKIDSLQIEEGPRGGKKTDKSHSARFDRGIKRKRLAHILLRLASTEEK